MKRTANREDHQTWLKLRNSSLVLGFELLAKVLGIFILLGVSAYLGQLMLTKTNEHDWWLFGLALYGSLQLTLVIVKSIKRDVGNEVEE